MKDKLKLLRMYYHVDSNRELIKVMAEDFLVSVLLFSGTGIITSFTKGFIAKLFIRSKGLLLIGKNFKVVRPSRIRLGKSVWIKDNVTLFASGRISIGNNCVLYDRVSIWAGKWDVFIENNVWVGQGTYLVGSGGTIRIGNNVLLADNVSIYTTEHKYSKKNLSIREQGSKNGSVIIKDNAWIGSKAVILEGVIIGKGSVVGAGAVVTSNVSDNTIVVGIPAKPIRRI